MYMSIQPPSLSLPSLTLVTVSWFFTPVTLSLFCRWVHLYSFFYIPHISNIVFAFLCLTYFIQYDSLWVHTCCCKQYYFILFYGWVILYCIYVPHLLYPFLCWWTLRLLPYPGYCIQYCSEHWGACIFLNYGFLQIYAQKWDCWIIW